MTLFLEFFLMLALYYMYSVQSQMIRLLENQMNHLHELNLILVGHEDDCESVDEDCCTEDCDCEDENSDCEEEDGYDDEDEDEEGDEEGGEIVGDNEKNEDDKEATCATCNRDHEKCRCPNPYKLLSKKSQ